MVAGLERRVKDICDAAGAACHRYGGFLLHEPEAIRNGSGEPYRVYTPFSKACFAAGEPEAPAVPKFTARDGTLESDRLAAGTCCQRSPTGPRVSRPTGRRARRVPQHGSTAFIADGLAHYADERDRPDRDVTSRLSPTCTSARSARPSAGTRCGRRKSQRAASSTARRRSS